MKLPSNAHPDITRVFEYYRAVSPPGALPSTHQFDPMSSDIPEDIVDRMVLVEIKHEPWTFVTRYAGAYIEDFASEHLKGKEFAERLDNPYRTRVERNLINVVRTAQPTWRRGQPMIRHETRNVTLERILLPLSHSGQTVDQLLFVTFHHETQNPEQSERTTRLTVQHE